ncbi:MAG: hypothetical protein J3K34DRAFT_521680 [Monoraphidium minutum]|nr:MAG: hypothetical protein J3K34DRAFT_521680 [Monoraphidium minutum]
MDSDTKIQQYILLGKSARGRALCELIKKATAEPGLFAFGELLDSPNIAELRQGEHAPHVLLLELFCYGTWPEYKEHRAQLPALSEQQQLKLKQLTVISLATQDKVLPYDRLMGVLDIGSMRELEDFLIAHCFYSGLIKGKLDQAARTLQARPRGPPLEAPLLDAPRLAVHQASSRDVRPEELPRLAGALDSWLSTAQGLLSLLDTNMTAASLGAEAAKARKAALERRQEEMKRNVKADFDLRGHGHEQLLDEFDPADDERGAAFGFGVPGPGGGAGGGGGGGGGAGGSGAGGGARPKRVRGKRGWQEGGGAP